MIEINDLQMDIIKEIGNIGVGNAATALSQLINKRVDISILQLEIIGINDLIESLGGEELVCVAMLLQVYGDIQGDILFLVDIQEVDKVKKLFNLDSIDDEEVTLSLFQEIANILGNAFLNALSKMLSMNAISSVPGIAIDMVASVIVSSFLDAEQYDDTVMLIDTNFYIEGNELLSKFIYIPKDGDMQKILDKVTLSI